MSPLPTRTADHWWQRPGRYPGRISYQWHLAFHDQPEVIELAEMAQERLRANAQDRLASVPPVPVTIRRIGYHPEAVTLLVEPAEALHPVLDAVRDATESAGWQGHADIDPWIPHVSVAYSHATGPAAPVIEVMGRSLPETHVTIKSISLVSQTQVGRSWQWQPVAEVYVGGPS